MKAVRTWLRDGSQNVMDLDYAAANLRSYALDRAIRKETIPTIIRRLRRGEMIPTALAEFRAVANCGIV